MTTLASTQTALGELFPDAEFYQFQRDGKWVKKYTVTAKSYETPAIFQQKKIVVFGVPGAFTPTCSKLHLPSFVKASEAFQKAGVGVYCLSTNSVDVLSAWIKMNDPTGTIGWLPDPQGTVTRQLRLGMDSDRLGFVAKRFAMILAQETAGYQIEYLTVEQDPAQCLTTSAESLLKEVTAAALLASATAKK